MPVPGVEDRYPGLAPLDPEARDDLARSAVRRVLPKGTLIFTEGTPCIGFPLVLRGSIRVFKVSAAGRELPLYRVGPGESCIISTVCLVGQVAYEARAKAEEETEVAIVTPAHFSRLLGDASFQRFVFALFARRLADLMLLVDALAFKRLDQRLALLLATGPRARRVTHQAIADELGTVREIASRLLKEFERAGLLTLRRGRIDVLDPEGLRRWGR
jgi:CRP/FNR family transcriptional regulator